MCSSSSVGEARRATHPVPIAEAVQQPCRYVCQQEYGHLTARLVSQQHCLLKKRHCLQAASVETTYVDQQQTATGIALPARVCRKRTGRQYQTSNRTVPRRKAGYNWSQSVMLLTSELRFCTAVRVSGSPCVPTWGLRTVVKSVLCGSVEPGVVEQGSVPWHSNMQVAQGSACNRCRTPCCKTSLGGFSK